jgi:hypothetical protein
LTSYNATLFFSKMWPLNTGLTVFYNFEYLFRTFPLWSQLYFNIFRFEVNNTLRLFWLQSGNVLNKHSQLMLKYHWLQSGNALNKYSQLMLKYNWLQTIWKKTCYQNKRAIIGKNSQRRRKNVICHNTIKPAHAVTCIKHSPFFLSCHRKFHMDWTSFKRSHVL